MKKIVSFFAVLLVCGSAVAAVAPGRTGIVSQYVGPGQRTPSMKAILPAGSSLAANKSSIHAETPSAAVPVDKRDTERKACINNNIGIGNTFVWASKFSNTNNYSSMVEDTENPDNNVCFVKVELKSDDPKINVSDIAPVYYEMGRDITCGSWANEDMIKSRILDAKKGARTWGTVAGAVGGAGVGVGAMELFGNRLIGGAVEGQRHLERNDKAGLLRSQLLVLKDKNLNEYNAFVDNLAKLKNQCETKDFAWGENGAPAKPQACTDYEYAFGVLQTLK